MTFAASCHISALLRAVGNERGGGTVLYNLLSISD